MSDEKEEEQKPFCIDRAKSGRSMCKKCRIPIDKNELRIAKLSPNPFGSGLFKAWHHVNCLFEVFCHQRATTRRIEVPENDIDDWETLCETDKAVVRQSLAEFDAAEPFKAERAKAAARKAKEARNKSLEDKKIDDDSTSENKIVKKKERSEDESTPDSKPIKKKKYSQDESISNSEIVQKKKYSQDDMFFQFQQICDKIASNSSYLDKTAILRTFFIQGSEKKGFKSDLVLWCRLLLPDTEKRIYRLHNRMLIKLFSRIFCQDEDVMLDDLEQGDVSETIKTFYKKSNVVKPNGTSDLSLQEVDEFLEELTKHTTEQEQIYHFKSILSRCTADDLKMMIRLIKHDLRINAGPKHVLEAIHKDAYPAFQGSRNLSYIVSSFSTKGGSLKNSSSSKTSPTETVVSPTGVVKSPNSEFARLKLMTPVKPMLAEACKSVEMAFEKFSSGMFSEVKYDGERVQVHKMGEDFRYYTRSLKPVLPHKVKFLKDYIPKAFPEGVDLILDAEILLIDTKNSQPLPFGSLGIHKKSEFKDANVCLFVFDILYYNNEPVMDKSITYRRKILETKMTPIPNRVVLSEIENINDPQKLAEMIVKVFKLGLEGLVLKSIDSKYEPGKRHWLKIKKDYLFEGAMADSADLVVIGAWYGYGQKGGIMSVFLMGCYDPDNDVWLTVTKVHTGLDDATLTELQGTLDMVKISKDPNQVPNWLKVHKNMTPDFVAKDPKNQPVWEITGAQFSNQGVHTADGISIRFPRVTRIRDDKDWKTATNLQELKTLFNKTTDSLDYSLLLANASQKHANKKPGKKIKKPPSSVRKGEDFSIPGNFEKPKTPRTKDEVEDDSDFSPDEETQANMSSMETEIVKLVQNKSRKKSPEYRTATEQLIQKLMVELDVDEAEPQKKSDDEDEKRAQFYSFVGTDYIEYSAAGSPLNWVKNRRPPKLVPDDAIPMKKRDVDKIKSQCILPDARIYYVQNLSKNRRQTIRRTLKTWNVNRLGAVLLSRSEQSKATHVVHEHERVPATILSQLAEIPKTARHVTESWIEDTAANCKAQDVFHHAVTIYGVYCSCHPEEDPEPVEEPTASTSASTS